MKRIRLLVWCTGLGGLLAPAFPDGAAETIWQPAQAPLMTRWAKEVARGKVHTEYPRPQMARTEWLDLNGLWEYAITLRSAPAPAQFQGRILVPFPVESALSGVRSNLDEKKRIWYRRKVEIPSTWKHQRVLLHFGAVDFEAVVSVNGREVGQHRGGYDPFSLDITDALNDRGDDDEIVVGVWDPGDAEPNARGKQIRKPDQGIFYTASSGIWQTVWLEPVPATTHIDALQITPDIDTDAVRVRVTAPGLKEKEGESVRVVVSDEAGGEIAISGGLSGQELRLSWPHVRLWTPGTPFLYTLTVTLERRIDEDHHLDLDKVVSYFGMRKISLGQDNGVTKIFLNNKPFFMVGPLDQGFWPDGLYTAPTDEALRYDIEVTKRLGFNMARKHVKVEPDRWYYWCDKLGLLVWQDMPSGDRFISPRDGDIVRTPESARQFERELKAMIDTHQNHPCIVMWVVFNEGWGQYDTARLAKWVKDYDPTRLVNSASGWADRGAGDVNDMHRYPGPGSPKPEEHRAAVLGEFGGLGFKSEGHTWAGRTWGYRGMDSVEKLTRQYVKLLRGVYSLKEKPGLSAAVYTQTTDVEYEGNGLLTYDREVIKLPVEVLAAVNRGQFPPEPKVTVLSPTSQDDPVTWRYTTNQPPEDWFKPGYDAAGWKEGPGGFGTRGTPGSVVRTEWKTSDIWLRREFTLTAAKFNEVRLTMHHDEDAEVYLNGVLAAKTQRWIGDYEDFDLSAESVRSLQAGRNVLAVHCHQTSGGQYIDAGLVNYEAPPP
jgi:hypothetical protein